MSEVSELSEPSEADGESPSARPQFRVVRGHVAAGSGRGSPLPALLAVGAVGLTLGGGYLLLRMPPQDEAPPADAAGLALEEEGALEGEPELAPPWVWERLAFLESENLERALAFAEEQLDDYPRDVELRRRAASYARQLGRDEQPSSTRDLIVRGVEALEAQDWSLALQSAEEVLARDPDEPWGYVISGCAKSEMGQRIAGRRDIEHAVSLGYPEEKARPLLQRFEER